MTTRPDMAGEPRKGWFLTRHSELFSLALALLASALLGVTAFLYHDLSSRMVSLNSGFKEDTLWAVYQVDREIRRFAHAIDVSIQRPDDKRAFKNLQLRYDIAWSRIDLLTKSGYLTQFKESPQFSQSVSFLSDTIKGAAPIVDGMAARGRPEIEELSRLRQRFRDLILSAEKLLLLSNNTISNERAERRENVINQSRLTERVVIALVITVFALLLLLRRQIANSRRISEETQRIASKLEDAYRGAEAGNRAKSSFLATISHEIRTPLNAIIGLSEILLERKLEGEIREDVHSIRNSGEVLLEILNEVLDYTSVENGAMKIEEREIAVSELLETCVDLFRSNAAKKGVALHLIPDANIADRWIGTDPTRLRQILLNLIGNAVKFTEKGAVTVNVRLDDNSDDGLILRVDVADTGPGISADGLEKLFRPFTQVDSSITRKFGGTGLGLAIAKGIIEKMGGRIGAQSSPGHGSNFWIELPVREALPMARRQKSHSESRQLPRLNVLVVEDNQTNRKVAASMLERLGQNVCCAPDGEQAVLLASQNSYDLILMDMQMPIMSGIEATMAIRASTGPNRQTRILAMTANASQDDRRACMEAGMDGFESKPVRRQRLETILQELTGQAAVAPEETDAQAQSASSAGGLLATVNPQRRTELIAEIGEDGYWELWDLYAIEARVLIEGISADFENGEVGEAHKKLHTLRGASSNMGLDRVAALARSLRETDDPLGNGGGNIELLQSFLDQTQEHFRVSRAA